MKHIFSLPLSPRLSAVVDGGLDAAVEVTVLDAAVIVTVVDAAVVVRAMDAAVAVMVDAGATMVVAVAVSILLVDSNGSRIATTIAGMSSVVKGLGAVLERWLRFGGGNSAVILFKSSDEWETTQDRWGFLTPVGRAVTPVGRAVRLPILDMVARTCAHALIF